MYTIYKIYNNIEKKFYIGCTSDFERRKSDHLSEGKFSAIKHLFDKLPKDSFEFSVLHDNIPNKEVALKIETEEIKKHDSVNNGYNNCYSQGFGGNPNIDPSKIANENWREGSKSRELLLKARKEQVLYTKYNTSKEANKNKSEGVRNFYKNPENKKRIKEIRDKIKNSMNTEESFIFRRDTAQKYDLILVARIKSIFKNRKSWGLMAKLSELTSISYSTVKDICYERYYSEIEPNDDVLKCLEFKNGKLININWDLLNESDK